MVIDDHELIILGIRLALKSAEQYLIINEVKSAEAAWTYLQEHHQDVDIIIADISLPDMDGIELCQRVKKEYPHITVVMYSMNESSRTIQDSIKAGANGFIKKGSSKNEFLVSLNQVVEKGNNFSHELLYENRMQARRERQKPTLTKREKQILELIAKQYTSEEIAQKLQLKKSTVDTHRSNMMQKFDVKTTLGLMVEALGIKLG